MTWNTDMDAAPREVEVLVCCQCETSGTRWVATGTQELDGRWFNIGDGILTPTAWMPLPQPPEQK